MAKVEIDQDACTGCGVCSSLCAEVFELSGDGKSKLVEKYQGDDKASGEVPDNVGCVEEAKENCPVDAISVE